MRILEVARCMLWEGVNNDVPVQMIVSDLRDEGN